MVNKNGLDIRDILPFLTALISFIPNFLIYRYFILCWSFIFSFSFIAHSRLNLSKIENILLGVIFFYGITIVLCLNLDTLFLQLLFLLPLLLIFKVYLKGSTKNIKNIYKDALDMTLDAIIIILIFLLLYMNYGFTNCIGLYLKNNNTFIMNVTGIFC